MVLLHGVVHRCARAAPLAHDDPGTLRHPPDARFRHRHVRRPGRHQSAARLSTTRSITLERRRDRFSRGDDHRRRSDPGRQRHARCRDSETATLTVPQPIPAGAAAIAIRYTGRLNDQLRGFYLSRANNRDYAITQLEATDARRAFPSFDEPAMKATFAVSATIDARDTAISNGRLLSDTPGPGAGKHTLKFATTKRMSPYLVALAVGDWECVDRRRRRHSDTRLRHAESQRRARLRARVGGVRAAVFQPLFLDQIPVREARHRRRARFLRRRDGKHRRDCLPRAVSRRSRRTAARLERRKQTAQYIAHEIAHQWFGDLVTMAWWDDIWLNEGFATWMEYRPMQESKPEWQGALDEVRDTQRAMALDALRTTRPVRTAVETPDEINQVFDAIAYQKTAAIIRMVEGYVGAAGYRDGINAYLKKFAFANATGEGFWTTLAAVTRKPVDRVLASFITQSEHAARHRRDTMRGREHRACACLSVRCRTQCRHRPCGRFRSATSASAMDKCSQPRARCCLASTQTAKLDGCSRGCSRTSTAAVITGRRTNAENLQALGEAASERPAHAARADDAPRRSLDAGSARRAEHRRISVAVESAREEPAQPGDRHRALAHQLHLRVDRRRAAAAGIPALGSGRRFDRCWMRLGWTPQPGEPEDIQTSAQRDLHAGKRRTRSRRAARSAAPRASSCHGRRSAACEHRRHYAAARRDRRRRRALRAVPGAHGRSASPGERAAVSGGARLLRRPEPREAHARRTRPRGHPHAGCPHAHPAVDAAAIGQRGNVGASQEQLGHASSDRSASSRGFPRSSGRFSTSATPHRETTSSGSSACTASREPTARCSSRWKPSSAASPRNRRRRRTLPRFSRRQVPRSPYDPGLLCTVRKHRHVRSA